MSHLDLEALSTVLQNCTGDSVEWSRTPGGQLLLAPSGVKDQPLPKPVAKPSLLESIADQHAVKPKPLAGQKSFAFGEQESEQPEQFEPVHHEPSASNRTFYHATDKASAMDMQQNGVSPESLNRRDSGFFGEGLYASKEPQSFYGKSIAAVTMKPEAKMLSVGDINPKSPQPWHQEFIQHKINSIRSHRPGIEQHKIDAAVNSVTPGHPDFSHTEYNQEVGRYARSAGFHGASFANGQETVVFDPGQIESIRHIGGLSSAQKHRAAMLQKEQSQLFSRDFGPVEFSAPVTGIPMQPFQRLIDKKRTRQDVRDEEENVGRKKQSPTDNGERGWTKVGGSSVHVNEDDEIDKGCPGLLGEKVDDLIDESDESRERREARQHHAYVAGIRGHQMTPEQAKSLGSDEHVAAYRRDLAAAKAHPSPSVSAADVARGFDDDTGLPVDGGNGHEIEQDRQRRAAYAQQANRPDMQFEAEPAKQSKYDSSQQLDPKLRPHHFWQNANLSDHFDGGIPPRPDWLQRRTPEHTEWSDEHEVARHAAAKYGTSIADVLAAVPQAHVHMLEQSIEGEKAKARARQLSGLDAGKIQRIENAYRDHSTVKNFDTAADSFALEYPDFGGADASSKMWDLVREGKQALPSINSPEVMDFAASMVAGGRRRYDNEGNVPEFESEDEQHYGDEYDEWSPTEQGDASFDPSQWSRPGSVDPSHVLGMVQASPNQPKDRDWGAFSERWGINEPFHQVQLPMADVLDHNHGGRLRLSKHVDLAAILAKMKSGKINPAVISSGSVDGKPTVIDGTHSLHAAHQLGMTHVPAFVSASAAKRLGINVEQQFSREQPLRFEPADVEHYVDTIRRNVTMRIPRDGETDENSWHPKEYTARHENDNRRRFKSSNVHLADVPIALLKHNPDEVAPERQERLDAIGGSRDPAIVHVDGMNGNVPGHVLNVDDGNNRVHWAKKNGLTHIPAFLHGEPHEIEAARQMIAQHTALDHQQQFSRSDSIVSLANDLGVPMAAIQAVIQDMPGSRSDGLASLTRLARDPSRRGIVRNRDGRVIGYVTKTGDRLQFRDADSRMGGTATHGHDRTTLRAKNGFINGTVQEFSQPLDEIGPVEFGRKPSPGQMSLPFPEKKTGRPQIESMPDGSRQVDIPPTRTNPALRATLKRGETDGLTHFVTKDENGRDWSRFRAPTHHVERFLDELSGHLNHPANSGHKTLDHVLAGNGKYLGKGNDNAVYDAGNGTVVKAAVLAPYHETHGIREPADANAIIDDSVKATKHLRSKGVLGILPQYGVSHDGRSFAVMPKVDTESPLTEKHIQQIHNTLKGMHESGYVLGDQIQAGLDHNGNAAIYDVGSIREGGGKFHDGSTPEDDDFSQLRFLAQKHGVKYETPKTRNWADQYKKLLYNAHESNEMSPREAGLTIMQLMGRKAAAESVDPDHDPFGLHDEVMAKLKRWADQKSNQPAVQMSRKPAAGQGSFGWDEDAHPRAEDGKFTDKLHHQIKSYLSDGTRRHLRDVHTHTGHTTQDALNPLDNPTNRALKALRDSGQINSSEPDYGEPMFYMTEEQLAKHSASVAASEKRDAKSDAKEKAESLDGEHVAEDDADVREAKPKIGSQGFKILKVEDTRQYEEGDDDKWYPVPGSGHDHECDRCGKNHVIHYSVQCRATGKELNVGSECAGQTGIDDKSNHKTYQSAASTVKKLQSMLDDVKKKLAKVPELESKLNDIPFPDWEVRPSTIFSKKPDQDQRYEVALGDRMQQLPESYHGWKNHSPHLAATAISEAKQYLHGEWKSDKLGELAGKAGLFDASKHSKSHGAYYLRTLKSTVEDIEKRLKKATAKMASLSAGEEKEPPQSFSRDGDFGSVEFARNPAKGQVSFDFESPVESKKKDTPNLSQIREFLGEDFDRLQRGEITTLGSSEKPAGAQALIGRIAKHFGVSGYAAMDSLSAAMKEDRFGGDDADDEPPKNIDTKQDHLFTSEIPPEHHEEAKALSAKHGGGEVRRLKNGDWQLRSPKGGKVSEVNGVYYPGGQFMPIHGLSKPIPKMKKVKPPTSDLFTPPKPNENGRQREQQREMTPDEIAERKRQQEDDQAWLDIQRGPLGRLLDLGDKPRHGQQGVPILDQWRPFAEKLGKEAVGKLKESLEKEWNDRIDGIYKKLIDEESSLTDAQIKSQKGIYGDVKRLTPADADYERGIPLEQADQWKSFTPRLYKSHEKLVPGSHLVRELLGYLMDSRYSDEPLIPRLKKYSDMLAALVPAPTIDVAEARQHGYLPNKFDGRTADGKKVKAGDGWVKKNDQGKYETFTDEQVKNAIKPVEFSQSLESIGPVEFARHEFASTQFDISGPAEKEMLKLARSIPKDELAEDGIETDAHITCLFGLHTDSPDEVRELVKDFGPVTIKFGKTSLFPANKGQEQRGGAQYDVLKIDIEGDDIHRLNKLLRKLDHTSTFPTYHPHATIAYLKPGEGEKYCGKNKLTGKAITFDSFEFSGKDRKKTTVNLADEPEEFSRDLSEIEPVEFGLMDWFRRKKTPAPQAAPTPTPQAASEPEEQETPAYESQWTPEVPVESSNVYSYAWSNESADGRGSMLVRYKSKSGGPGPIYKYHGTPKAVYTGMSEAASKGQFVWDKLRQRGTKVGHKFPYSLAGTGHTDYVPRQAALRRGLKGEHFIERTFNGQKSQLEPGTTTGKPAEPIAGYSPDKISFNPPAKTPAPSVPKPPKPPGSSLLGRVTDYFKKRQPKQFSREECREMEAYFSSLFGEAVEVRDTCLHPFPFRT